MLKVFVLFLMAGVLILPGLAGAKGIVRLPATNQTACFDTKGNPRACTGRRPSLIAGWA